MAHLIRSDAEALAAAHKLAALFREEAPLRDRDRRLPHAELDLFSESGLWGMTVPRRFGGAAVSYATVAQVFAIIAAADPSISQIQQNHISAVFFIGLLADEAQKRHFLGAILGGKRFGNASSERTTSHSGKIATRLRREGDDIFIHGKKFYATGALYAHFVTVIALDEEERAWVAVVPQDAPGLEIIDDWSGFGQRTTASGTVILNDVRVRADHLLPLHRAYEEAAQGAISQITHVGIDAGIARNALTEAIRLLRGADGATRPISDPLLISEIGRLSIQIQSAETMMERAGRILDVAVADPGVAHNEAALVAVAEAKVLTTEAALRATTILFDLVGHRRPRPSMVWIAYGGMPAPIRCTTPCAGAAMLSAIIVSTMHRCRDASDDGDPFAS